MVSIEAGSFEMGSAETEAGRDPDETLHTVTLSRGFLLGRTEVTQAQFDG
jgi:formylglycine-generating enzyme required for sulfatase activity